MFVRQKRKPNRLCWIFATSPMKSSVAVSSITIKWLNSVR
ncbi:Uncharacterised protein [Vibrio cholerae]|nr:Uncharacterised protein [Vibrio cholerae]